MLLRSTMAHNIAKFVLFIIVLLGAILVASSVAAVSQTQNDDAGVSAQLAQAQQDSLLLLDLVISSISKENYDTRQEIKEVARNRMQSLRALFLLSENNNSDLDSAVVASLLYEPQTLLSLKKQLIALDLDIELEERFDSLRGQFTMICSSEPSKCTSYLRFEDQDRDSTIYYKAIVAVEEKLEPSAFITRQFNGHTLGAEIAVITGFSKDITPTSSKTKSLMDSSAISAKNPTSGSKGRFDVLFVRVDFADVPAPSPSMYADFEPILRSVSDGLAEMSNFQVMFDRIVITNKIYRLPKNATWYSNNDGTLTQPGVYIMANDAIALANQDGYICSDFRFCMFALPYNSLFALGLGQVVGNWIWLNGLYDPLFFDNAQRAIAHEVGHNFGLFHANSITTYQQEGYSREYGDQYDLMGLPSIVYFNNTIGWRRAHFNTLSMSRLGWINDKQQVITYDNATGSHSYQVWSLDTVQNLQDSRPLGVRVLYKPNWYIYFCVRSKWLVPQTQKNGGSVNVIKGYTGNMGPYPSSAVAVSMLVDTLLQTNDSFALRDAARPVSVVVGQRQCPFSPNACYFTIEVRTNATVAAPIARDKSVSMHWRQLNPVAVVSGSLGSGNLTITSFTNSSEIGGTLSISSDRKSLVFFSDASQKVILGTKYLYYTVADAKNNTAVASIAMTMTNTAPDAVNDTFVIHWKSAIGSNSSQVYDVLANDFDADEADRPFLAIVPGSLAALSSEEGAVASLNLTSDMKVGITMQRMTSSRKLVFSYNITDGIEQATALVDMSFSNAAPIAMDDGPLQFNMTLGSCVLIDVLANDFDSDGDPIIVASVYSGSVAKGVNISVSEDKRQLILTYLSEESQDIVLSYHVTDGLDASVSPAKVFVSVKVLRDKPAPRPDSNSAQVAGIVVGVTLSVVFVLVVLVIIVAIIAIVVVKLCRDKNLKGSATTEGFVREKDIELS